MVHSELLRLARLGALARLEAIDRDILTLLRHFPGLRADGHAPHDRAATRRPLSDAGKLPVAGAFVRSLSEAERADLGFRPEGVLNIHMDVGQLGYSEAQGQTFFDEVDRRVRSIPGVQNVSFAFTIPMGYVRVSTAIEAEDQPVDSDSRVSAGQNMVSAEYFQTMGIPIVRGRSFERADNELSRPVAVVNQRLAEMLWPDRDPIGRRLKSPGPDSYWIEVVGVANTGKYQFLFEDPQPYLYLPIAQAYTGLRVLQVRASIPGRCARVGCRTRD